MDAASWIMPPTTEQRAPLITSNSFVSIGLVTTLVIGGVFLGRQLNRIDVLEGRVAELRVEFNAHRDGTAHPQPTGR